MAGEDKLREYLKRVTVDLADARRRLAEADARRHEPIAVVGMSCRFPGADGVDAYWRLLAEGRSAVLDEVPGGRFDLRPQIEENGVYTTRGAFLPDVAGWDARFFGVSPQEALRMDPQQRLLMELAWEALEDAGTPPPRLAGSRTAVMAGFSDPLQYARVQHVNDGQALFNDPYAGQGASASVVAGRLAYHFDFRGPTLTLDTACSSSLVAVHLAGAALRRGECDRALAAGAFLVLHTDMYVNGCATSMLAPDGLCKTFDAAADGYVLGEGAGVLVLKRLSDALADGDRVHAVVRGTAVNQDGRSNGLTAPSRQAQVDVIRRALAAAGAAPDEVAYVEAHGSGTQLGDAIELGALSEVFGNRRAESPLRVGAVKTNVGHTQAAAGMAGLIKAVLVLKHGTVPPNLNMAEPAESVREADGIAPVACAQPLPSGGDAPVLAGVSSFGWCGTNAHAVLAAAPEANDETSIPMSDREVLLPVSAACEPALGERLSGIAGRVDSVPLADTAYTLQSGRAHLEFRRAILATDRADAAARLADAAGAPGTRTVEGRPRVAYLLPGTGDQYPGMAQDLYRAEPVFAEAVEACLTAVRERCGTDLRPALFAAPEPGGANGRTVGLLLRPGADDGVDEAGAHRAETTHLTLFTVEYALARLLAHYGVLPDALIGYSLGEYVAACLAGVFTLDDALWVVASRARLIEAAPPGRMLAVAADADRVAAELALCGAQADVAAINGPAMTVVSGTPEAIATAARHLADAGLAHRILRSAHPFHSALLAPARDQLAAVVASVPRTPPATTLISNVTGAPLTADQATDPAYWAGHLTSPVRFADGLRACAETGVDAYVELGPGQTLGGLLRQNATPGGADPAVLGTLAAGWQTGAGTDERARVLETCGRLWELGVDLDWAAVRGDDTGRLVELPAYPFQRTRYWPEAAATTQLPTSDSQVGATTAQDLCYAPVWNHDITVAPEPEAHDVGGGPLVVFADPLGVGAALADRAQAAGAQVVEVVAGTEFRRDGRRVTIDPAEPAHYRELFAALPSVDTTAPLRIAHLWSLREPTGGPGYADDAELREAVRYGFDSLLHTVQALATTGQDVRLLTCTSGAAEVVGGDCVHPQQAMAHGFGRVVRAEHPGIDWRGLDLDPADSAERSARWAAEELDLRPWDGDPDDTSGEPGPGLVARRNGRRLVKDWRPVPLPDGGRLPVRTDGVYLVTGGTRGLGLALARHLVGLGVRRLALVGRTDLRAAATDPEGRAAAALAAVAELEADGADVLLLSADVGDPDALRRALGACREHFGALHGVLHAAGLPSAGMAARLTPDAAHRVLAPKVHAMGPLAELTGPTAPHGQRLELLVLYSSAVTVFGGLGEGDYCAANSVLDAYGEALAATAEGTRVLTVAWGPWRHDDWQAEGLGGALADRVRAHRERYGFGDEGGCAFLGRVAAAARGAVVAVRQPLKEGLREWAAITDLDALVGETAAAAGRARFPRPRLRTEYVAPRTPLETAIADSWGHHLGIEAVGVHDPFFDLGGNSLVGMAMVAAIEKRLERRIAPAVLFQHPTVAAFAAALDDRPAGAAPAAPASDSGSARGERRRRARGAHAASNSRK
ncbi:SDR family NAD(P)-dependent oxidoreductase [Streptomyces sp. PTM05]|uniref:SDR family NAD(P)-dependent oxidoreductase n=1 Tax=Streptantibioticus parmotrematis TaxID=2873249 RepID=A0ABS7QU16_9ACTN|nr:type I polyketide synthase [Streptantibioticus parmotrematis]MBY8885299.1 SDR family NAD(P)-dependent oxidoreductase [Streptantibioticus parmotrematis]